MWKKIAQEVIAANCVSKFVEELLITDLCRKNAVSGAACEREVKKAIKEIRGE